MTVEDLIEELLRQPDKSVEVTMQGTPIEYVGKPLGVQPDNYRREVRLEPRKPRIP